jgi:hypothetical protein
MRRAVLLAATMAITVVLAVVSASADPINGKNAQTITFDCGGEKVTLVTKVNPSVVSHVVVDSTANFVATKLVETFTYTDPETGEVVHEVVLVPIGEGQKQGLQPSLITCDQEEHFIFEDPERGTVTLEFTLTGFFTPREGSDGDS